MNTIIDDYTFINKTHLFNLINKRKQNLTWTNLFHWATTGISQTIHDSQLNKN